MEDLNKPGRITVINPNSSDAVTESIDKALDPLRWAGGPVIDCLTLSEGPPGIETPVSYTHLTLPTNREV